MALLFADSFKSLSGNHHVPHNKVDKIIAKFGLIFLNIDYVIYYSNCVLYI
jgi:hypothetical protein